MPKKKPLQDTMPKWWNRNGAKMEVKHADDRVVMLANSTASVSIRPVRDARGRRAYHISTILRQLGRDKFRNDLTFPEEYLAAAFAVTDEFHGANIPVIRNQSRPGYFVRSGCHLNIPGRGSGRDGDPNASLLLEPEVREAVNQLMFINSDRPLPRRPTAGPPAPEGYRSDNANTTFSSQPG